jgi:tetratricopeptide (TPR) repeat protein
MSGKVIIPILIVTVIFLISGRSISANEEVLGLQAEKAGKHREAIDCYIKALQSVPEGSAKDQQLRERVISLAHKIKPAPIVPEEAERYMARGRAAVKSAATIKDFEDAASQFSKVLRVAPWLSEGYYNLGVVQDKAGRYQDAIRNLKYYLLAAPNAQDAKRVRSLIFEIEYRQEKTQRESDKMLTEQKAKANLESLTGEYSENRWDGIKYNWVPGAGSKPFSMKPSRNGPWVKDSGNNIYVQINGSKITITIRSNYPQAVRTSAVFQGTITGTRIEGTMTETWHHRFSCPKIVNYLFEGTIWPEEREIMLITEDCYTDGNPQHGLGCLHHQNNCFQVSYLLRKK